MDSVYNTVGLSANISIIKNKTETIELQALKAHYNTIRVKRYNAIRKQCI